MPYSHSAVGRISTRGRSSTCRLTACGRKTSGAIALGRALTRSVDQPITRLRVWLLDEVTSIFGEETVVCTGSSWSESGDVERDLLAGRAGNSSVRRSRLLLPMAFRDFLKVTANQIPVPAPMPPWNLQGSKTAAVAVSLEPFTDELDLAWQAT